MMLKHELQIRGGWVKIETLPDDFRNAPVDFNLNQKLVIPDCAKEPSRLATVAQLGQNGYEYTVKCGDVILCNRYPKSFQVFHWFDGEEWQRVEVMKEEEILAKLEVK